jgi:hypothetical protein
MEEMTNIVQRTGEKKITWRAGHRLEGNIEMHPNRIFYRIGFSRLGTMASNDGCSQTL